MTDFYVECETGIVTLLQTLTTFFPHDWQVSDDDTNIMKGAEYFVIVRPGAFPYFRRTEQLSTIGWNVTIDLYVSYKEYKQSWNKFKAVRSAIFNLLMESPTLNDTLGVIRVDLTGDEQAQYLKFSEAPEAKPNFIVQTMRAIVTQYIQHSSSEF
jgi:hypothetical protein